jgi:uncharacterized protein YgiM (DUF1202 family)
MKKQLLMVLMILPAVLYTTLTSAAETVFYVQSTNASILSAPKFGSRVISRVTKGESLTSLSQEGRWIKVNVDGKIGYISSFLVSNHPPLAKQTVIKADEVDEIKPNARRRASSFTSAAAARGLTSDENKEEADKNAPDYKAVEKMEAVKVTPAEVTKFKETGK